ncbi:MAG: hypothetical protein AMXMBFR82_06220 [Candidatus Hydrogenedentota bacterium]
MRLLLEEITLSAAAPPPPSPLHLPKALHAECQRLAAFRDSLSARLGSARSEYAAKIEQSREDLECLACDISSLTDAQMTAERGRELYLRLQRVLAGLQSISTHLDEGGPCEPTKPAVPQHVEEPLSHSLSLDENVQFSVYRPRTVEPSKWYPMLAFAHLDALSEDAAPDEADPIEEVHRQAESILGEKLTEYRESTHDSRATVPHEGEITFLPEVTGIQFNPPRRVFLWVENVHREEFRLRADASLEGQTARGSLSVFLGSILLAEVTLAIRVQTGVSVSAVEPAHLSTARPYRKVFASYSHQDTAIVQEFERYARALGDTYLRDWIDLRAGEIWNDRLLDMIREADVFQLFWSSNAMRSEYVAREYQYALALNRPHFVRPTYWEQPLPENPSAGLPPEELKRLHFQCLTVSDGASHGLASQTRSESREEITSRSVSSASPSVPPSPAPRPQSKDTGMTDFKDAFGAPTSAPSAAYDLDFDSAAETFDDSVGQFQLPDEFPMPAPTDGSRGQAPFPDEMPMAAPGFAPPPAARSRRGRPIELWGIAGVTILVLLLIGIMAYIAIR